MRMSGLDAPASSPTVFILHKMFQCSIVFNGHRVTDVGTNPPTAKVITNTPAWYLIHPRGLCHCLRSIKKPVRISTYCIHCNFSPNYLSPTFTAFIFSESLITFVRKCISWAKNTFWFYRQKKLFKKSKIGKYLFSSYM